jgi:hypothetical protein
MYAKIKENIVLVCPYGYDELCRDNLHTKYSGQINLMSIFVTTQEYLSNGCTLVEITETKSKFIDYDTKKVIDSNSGPVLHNGQWTIVLENKG